MLLTIDEKVMKKKDEFESNELIDRLPAHLKQFIKPQK
jgi:hypothetical protein